MRIVKVENGRAGRYVASFFRKGELRQEYANADAHARAFPPEWRVFHETMRLRSERETGVPISKAS
jgi:hypothetical protein